MGTPERALTRAGKSMGPSFHWAASGARRLVLFVCAELTYSALAELGLIAGQRHDHPFLV